MSVRSPKSKPTSSGSTSPVISSLASAAGRSRSGSPGGRRTDRSGPPVCPASPSAKPVASRSTRTSGTSSPTSAPLSTSAALQSSLESRLRHRMDAFGSPEYGVTWKSWAMSSGPPICALRAYPLLTSGRGSIGALSTWPTPSSRDWKDSAGQETETTDKSGHKRSRKDLLARVVHDAFIPATKGTPSSPARTGNSAVSGWPTVTVGDATGSGNRNLASSKAHEGHSLTDVLFGQGERHADQHVTRRGAMASDLPCWLQGYPPAWNEAGKRAWLRMNWHKSRVGRPPTAVTRRP